MDDERFTVKFRGVRGGFPVPGPTTSGVGGNTTCLEVRVGGHLIIIDAGTGIISLGDEMMEQYRRDKKPIVATMLFTHTHHDHTQGFPFFVPTRLALSTFYIFGPKQLHEDLEAALARAMLPPAFPLDVDELMSMRLVRNVREGEMIAIGPGDTEPRVHNFIRDRPQLPDEAVKIWLMRSYAHPQGGVYIYKILWRDKNMTFATDTEGYHGWDRRLSKFARGADLLIHDAEYTEEEYLDPRTPKQGWGHSTWNMAVDVARLAGAKRLALFHHNARHDDDFMEAMEKQAQEAFPAAFVAREGMMVEL